MTFIFRRSTSLRATLQRPLPGEVVIFKSKTSCGPRHDCQHAMLPREAHEFDTPVLVNLISSRRFFFFIITDNAFINGVFSVSRDVLAFSRSSYFCILGCETFSTGKKGRVVH